MRKHILWKCMITVLCTAIIFTAAPVAAFRVFATEVNANLGETDEIAADAIEENTRDKESNTYKENVPARDFVEENFEEDNVERETGGEVEATTSNNQDGGERNGKIEETKELGIIVGAEETETVSGIVETETISETAETEIIEETIGTLETKETGIMKETEETEEPKEELFDRLQANQGLSIASVETASGFFQNTSWNISSSGKLTITGIGDVRHYNDGHTEWYQYRDSITSAEINVIGMYNASGLFEGCSNLESVELSGFDTSSITDMSHMFYGCDSLTCIDVSGFDTSNVTDMSYMFHSCHNLTSLDLSNFDTSNVVNMGSMFSSCYNLTSLDLSNFGTSNVTNMHNMFDYCQGLTSIDLSGFDTSKVTDMQGMFSNCEKLTNIDVSGFDTSNVTDMSFMFSDCSNLTSIDLSNFNTLEVKNMAGMFLSCTSLTSLDLSNFDVTNVAYADGMLEFCYLNTIYTPYNVIISIPLPVVKFGDVWYRSNGVQVAELPQGLDRSVVLMKNKIPTTDIPEEDSADDEMNYVRNLTKISLKNADEESKKSVESAIYNLLFKAEYCPMETEIPEDAMLFPGTKDIIAKWPIQNIDYNTKAYWNRTVNDGKLGTIKFNNAGAGCMSYAYFATTYTYGTNGNAKECYDTSADGVKEFIHKYADPGEHLRYEKPHSLVFLGESPDGNGFYCISYEGGMSKRGTFHLLRLMYKSYDNFSKEVAGRFSIFDANNGSYYMGTARSVADVRNGNGAERIVLRLACPVEAKIMLNGETLDSRSLGTASYGMVERDGEEIIFDLKYSSDYDFEIVGTGEGVMTLTLEYYDISDALIDQRAFVKFPIKASTVIRSSGFDSQATFVLYASNGSEEMDAWGASIGETVYFSDNLYRGDNDSREESEYPSSSSPKEENNTNKAEETNSEWNQSNRIDVSEGIGETEINIETWKPTTPDERKRYAYMSNETIQYILDENNAYRLIIENALQGKLCFDSFEAVLGEFTIGRTYNVYPYPTKVYNMLEEVQFTIKVPKSIYAPNRIYRMICVTKGGLPIIYEDLDTNPETITVRTNNFYAYALVYKENAEAKK